MKKIAKEFREFISRGNVMDMAVGVIVGGAFGKITSSLVNDVFMPFLGWVIGDIDLTALNITLSPAVMQGDTVVKEAVVVGIGNFIATIIDFLLIALVVFLFVKAVNTARAKLEKPAEEEAPAAPPEPSNEEKLLGEIRDLLKNRESRKLLLGRPCRGAPFSVPSAPCKPQNTAQPPRARAGDARFAREARPAAGPGCAAYPPPATSPSHPPPQPSLRPP